MSKRLIAFFLLLGGCGATEEQLRARAAFDLECREESLHIVEIDEKTRGVRGCGQHATYVEHCTAGNGGDCTWILNSEAKGR